MPNATMFYTNTGEQYANEFNNIHPIYGHIDGLAWNCGSSSADALELLQTCAGPSVSERKLLYTYVAMLPWSYWWLGMEYIGIADNHYVPTHREPPYSRYANICHLLIVLTKTHCLLLHVPHCNASVLLLLMSVWWTNMIYVKYVIEEYSHSVIIFNVKIVMLNTI